MVSKRWAWWGVASAVLVAIAFLLAMPASARADEEDAGSVVELVAVPDADVDADLDAGETDASDAEEDDEAGVDAGVDAEVEEVDAGTTSIFDDLASVSIGGGVRPAEEEPPDASAPEPPPVRIDEVETAQPDVRAVPKSERPSVVIKTILGLVALLALAYAAGNARVRQLERKIGVSQLITAGFPFIALGVLARVPSVGILTDSVLAEIAPVLRIGLGWIGFTIGFRIDGRALEQAAVGSGAVAAARAAATVIAVSIACGAALVLLGAIPPAEIADARLFRDGLILGLAGSMTSLVTPRLLASRGADERSVRIVDGVARFEELLGIVGLLAVAAYFRPAVEVTWQLPGTAWVLMTIGLGASIGFLLHAVLLRERTKAGEWVVVVLGSVAFAAGLSGKLHLSPVVVCFLVGLVLANFPGKYRDGLRRALLALERPVYLVFMVIVGALWDVRDGRGWALMLVFVVARLAGGWLGTRMAELGPRVEVTKDARKALAISPFGALSIAIVVNAQILYPSTTIPLIATSILGGAIVTEVAFQLLTRGGAGNGEHSTLEDEEEEAS